MNTSALNSPSIQSPNSLRNGNRLKAPSKVLKKSAIKLTNNSVNSTPNRIIPTESDVQIPTLRNENVKLQRRMKLKKIQREMNTQGLLFLKQKIFF